MEFFLILNPWWCRTLVFLVIQKELVRARSVCKATMPFSSSGVEMDITTLLAIAQLGVLPYSVLDLTIFIVGRQILVFVFGEEPSSCASKVGRQ